MNARDLISGLDLPTTALVDRRVPKTMLQAHGALTAADKRRIGDGIEQLVWVAALKPTTIGVAAYQDGVREYLEIAVLHLTLRTAADKGRLVDLVHRAVPYPLVLVAEHGSRTLLSLAHKRWSRGEAGRTVLDGDLVGVEWSDSDDDPHDTAFRAALAVGRQPRLSLHALYQGWMDAVLALQAARVTGSFAVAISAERAALRRTALQECVQLDNQIARLRWTAAKEKQVSRRVELNLELKRMEAARAAARAKL